MMMSQTVLTYARGILSHVPWTHWVVMGVVSLALTVILLIRKKSSVYGAIALGITVFVGILLLETTVVIRFLGLFHHSSAVNLSFSFDRLFHGTKVRGVETLCNIAVFIPFGFFMAEFLASTKRHSSRQSFLICTLIAFGFSLSIECLQLVLHVGYFEVMDLVLNTLGGIVGALISVGVRKVVEGQKSFTSTPN